jgi:hypothetical protein
MDVIANIAALIVTFVVGVFGNIVAHDICATADARCARIIGRAAKRLAAFDIETTEQEWLADLSERETVREKYRHAIGCYLAAPRMRRQAQTVTISVRFIVKSVGIVPFAITIDPVFGTRLLNAMGDKTVFSRSLTKVLIFYHLGKIMIAAYRLGPGCLPRFVNELKNYKKWEVEVQASRKRWNMDFSKVARLYLHDRETAMKFLKQYPGILSNPDGVKLPSPEA